MIDALRRYAEDVRRGAFPAEGEYWSMDKEELSKLREKLAERRDAEE
jgi:hypothetical protein